MLIRFINNRSSPDILFYMNSAGSMVDLIRDSIFRSENTFMYLTHSKPSRLTRFILLYCIS